MVSSDCLLPTSTSASKTMGLQQVGHGLALIWQKKRLSNKFQIRFCIDLFSAGKMNIYGHLPHYLQLVRRNLALRLFLIKEKEGDDEALFILNEPSFFHSFK